MKFLYTLFFIIALLVARILFYNQNDKSIIKIALHQVAGDKTGGRTYASLVDNTSTFKFDPKAYSLYKIWKVDLDLLQGASNNYSSDITKLQHALRGYFLYDNEINDLVKPNFDNALYVFAGMKKDGGFFLILDINRDKNFLNDKEMRYRTQKVPLDSLDMLINELPTIKAITPVWDKDHFEQRVLNLKFFPKAYWGGYSSTLSDSIANILNFTLASSDYCTGNFKIGDKEFALDIANGFPDTRFTDSSQVVLWVKEKGANKNILNISDDYLLYQLGDTIPIAQGLYTIKKIDAFGRSVSFKYSGKNFEKGIITGSYAKNIVSNDILTNRPVNLDSLRGHYILIDFWGIWCGPCIEVMPELKTINTLYQKDGLKMISVAYDKNLGEVKKFVKKESMNWINIFQSMNTHSTHDDIVGTYKVGDFPTFILIDTRGKIIFRGNGVPDMEKLKTVLAKTF